LKILVLGEAGVGKTSLIRRLATNNFKRTYLFTVGMDPITVKIPINGDQDKFTLNLWDIAGQANFQVFKQAFYRDSEAAVAVFDLTRPASLEKLHDWINEFRDRCGENKPVLLVGNKHDLEELISIDEREVEEFSRSQNVIAHLKTSALTGEGVLDAFQSIIHGRIDNN
jgi:small GTP-binding protein